uniref:Putative secreted protein n=1 Tax=Anopheles marajoara TaxID=58244 RepID=A0A2M4CDY5_9DIPT
MMMITRSRKLGATIWWARITLILSTSSVSMGRTSCTMRRNGIVSRSPPAGCRSTTGEYIGQMAKADGPALG